MNKLLHLFSHQYLKESIIALNYGPLSVSFYIRQDY